MRTTLLRYLLAIPLLSTIGCASILAKQNSGEETAYVLSAPTGYHAKRRSSVSLLVRPPEAPLIINSHQLLYSDAPHTRKGYRLASWTEPPPRRVGSLLANAIREAEIVREVTDQGGFSQPDRALLTTINEFYLDLSSPEKAVVVEIQAELFDLIERKKIGHRNFTRRVPVTSISPGDAVSAFSIALSGVLDELMVWLDSLV